MSDKKTRTEIEVAKFNTLAKIVSQLESCNYEDEGGYLHRNVAFMRLKEMSENEIAVGEKIDQQKTNGDNRFWIEVKAEQMLQDFEWAKLLMLLNHLLSASPGKLGAYLCEQAESEDVSKLMDFVIEASERDCAKNFPPNCQCIGCKAKRLVPADLKVLGEE